MNRERSDERVAKEIVEQELHIELDHHDTHGGVDYISADGRTALEVTAVTDGWRSGARRALEKSERKGAPGAPLQDCWIVSTSLEHENLRSFVQRVQPMIAQLEQAGQTRFFDQEAGSHVLEKGTHAAIYLQLLEAGVENAVNAPHSAHIADPDHVHQVHTVSGSGGAARGSDDAISRLMQELSVKTDNPKKLRESGAEQRHLFVWVNHDTEFGIARPLSSSDALGQKDWWGLPTAAPELDRAITHLWVMHAGSRRGWLWDGEVWRDIEYATRGAE